MCFPIFLVRVRQTNFVVQAKRKDIHEAQIADPLDFPANSLLHSLRRFRQAHDSAQLGERCHPASQSDPIQRVIFVADQKRFQVSLDGLPGGASVL